MSISKWMGGVMIVASLGLVGCGGDEPKPATPAADTMKEKMKEGADTVKEKAKEGADAVKEGATKAADTVKEGAEKAKDAVESK